MKTEFIGKNLFINNLFFSHKNVMSGLKFYYNGSHKNQNIQCNVLL